MGMWNDTALIHQTSPKCIVLGFQVPFLEQSTQRHVEHAHSYVLGKKSCVVTPGTDCHLIRRSSVSKHELLSSWSSDV